MITAKQLHALRTAVALAEPELSEGECVAASQALYTLGQAVQPAGAIRKPTPPIRRDAALKQSQGMAGQTPTSSGEQTARPNVDPDFEARIKDLDW